MSNEKFSVIKGVEVDSQIIDAVFDFMDERYEEGYHASQIIVAMLCVVQMLQEAQETSQPIH